MTDIANIKFLPIHLVSHCVNTVDSLLVKENRRRTDYGKDRKEWPVRGVGTRAQPVNALSYSKRWYVQGKVPDRNGIQHPVVYGPSAEQLIPVQHSEWLSRAIKRGNPAEGQQKDLYGESYQQSSLFNLDKRSPDPSSLLEEEERQPGPQEGPWVILVAVAGGSGHRDMLWSYGVHLSKQRYINRGGCQTTRSDSSDRLVLDSSRYSCSPGCKLG